MRSGAKAAVTDTGQQNELLPEDVLRAEFYQLVGAPLSAAPTRDILDLFANLSGDETPLGTALTACADAARKASVEAEDDHYHDLFVGVGSGILIPFGSYYLTGFLHEKPLARLRDDMAGLGIEQDPNVAEPEDHIASVLEMMAGLIEGRFGPPASLAEQEAFFRAHVGSWATHFFNDLAKTKPSAFYRAVGSLGSTFIEIEKQAFEYVETST